MRKSLYLSRSFQFVLERDFRYSICLFAISVITLPLAKMSIKADRGRHYRQVVLAKSTL